MTPADRLTKKLLNVAVPVPSLVLLSAMVGFGDVLQHTPLALMALPPSLVILPPEVAVVLVILRISLVVKEGKAGTEV